MAFIYLFAAVLFSGVPGPCHNLPAAHDTPMTPAGAEVDYLGGLPSVVGLAVDRKTREPLYCEAYFQLDNQKVRVDYYLDNQLYARKLLDYSPSITAPLTYQYDLRHGEIREAVHSPQGVVSYYRKNAKSPIEISDPYQGVVVDAGFNRFVVEQWGELQKGVTFEFLSPVHARTVELAITPDKNCGEESVCLSVGINNRFLKWLFGEMRLEYDANRRLRHFDGVVNILSERGKSQKAIISYFYRDENSTAGVLPNPQ